MTAYTTVDSQTMQETQARHIYTYSLWGDLYKEGQTWGKLVDGLAVVGSMLLSRNAGIPGAVAAALIFAMELTEWSAGRTVEDVYWNIWWSLLDVYAVNNENDPDFGVEIMQRFHYVVTPQRWDLQSFTTYHFAYYNGYTIQVSPLPRLVIPLDAASAGQFWMESVMWIDLAGTNRWVWIGPLEVPE